MLVIGAVIGVPLFFLVLKWVVGGITRTQVNYEYLHGRVEGLTRDLKILQDKFREDVRITQKLRTLRAKKGK